MAAAIQNRRPPADGERRTPITITVDKATHSDLRKIGKGNRSAAVEHLVALWRAKQLQADA